MTEGKADRQLKEMKPPFMMLKSSPHNLLHNRTISSPLVSGKLADESQLGQLTSLFSDPQQTKIFHAPKPPKKRYLEENYSQNKFNNAVIDTVSLSVGALDKNLEMSSINIMEAKKKKTDENHLFPDVNPILPDVVPKTECKDMDARTSWRKKLLCWEKLEETEPAQQLDRLQPRPEIKPTSKLSNRNRQEDKSTVRKPTRLKDAHCPKQIDTATCPKPGRRGRARACKGQKYREFMWTNVIHQRRKSSRWELCQDAVQSSVASDEDFTLSRKSKTDSHPKKSHLVPRSSTASSNEVNGVDSYYKKKKVTRKKVLDSPGKKADLNKSKSRSSESPKKKHSKRETISVTNTSETSSNELLMVTGSKKRKLRRQSIRRLEPGTSFKDTRVIEDSGLDTLASIALTKMKLRSGSDN